MSLILISISDRTYQRGQVPDTFISHGSIHSMWNWWLQGSTRRSWPLIKSSVQIGHEKLPASGISVLASGAVGVGVGFSLSSGVGISDSWGVDIPMFPSAWECSRSSAPTISTFLLAASTSSFLSSNLTTGIVSNIARAIPRARLCRTRPAIRRGPYRSGLR